MALLTLTTTAFAARAPQVKIKDGKLRGSYDETAKVYSFKGIPYATPPVGPLRWTAPVPNDPWKGVREATTFGPHCMQGNVFPDMIFRDPGPSEDCLTVNVWTPSVAGRVDMPVMFWIHGGGFAAGGSSEPRQDGANLAKRGVVVVSLNYRLNIFGFFTHSELTKESTHHASGNYGLLDMALALDWVHDNIAAFGGDPSKITIFGESAGSFAVSELMASPVSKNSFARAAGESGAPLAGHSLAVLPLEAAETEDAKFAKQIGAPGLGALRALSAQTLLDDAIKPGITRFAPVIDGYFLPEPVIDIYKEGKQAHVPLLAGWNKNEGGTPEQSKTTVELFTAQAKKNYGARADEFLKLYPASDLAEAKNSAADYGRDNFIALGTWEWIEQQLATGQSPVYRYFFTHVLPPPAAERGAYHSADIEFVFDNLQYKDLKWRPEDDRLAKMMADYWTNFAKTGDPNGPGLPNWPQFTASGSYQVMDLDVPPRAFPDDQRARYAFLNAK